MKNNLNTTKYSIKISSKFKRQVKKLKNQGKDLSKLVKVVKRIADGNTLDSKYKLHLLRDTNTFRNCYECHIEPDWLLIFKYSNDNVYLILVETGTHSELLNL